MASTENLQLITYASNPDALFQLRKFFQDGGFRNQEREITYAVKRRESELLLEECTSFTSLFSCNAFVFNMVLFDWTSQYGMSLGRPLLIAFVVWIFSSMLYFVCIRSAGNSGLYRVRGEGLLPASSLDKEIRKVEPIAAEASPGLNRLSAHVRGEWSVFRTCMFFSLMSAFNIGFQQLDFGRWLRLLTREEFDIKAIGWARVVAGWQSLISVYLFALWVLTYFGRPFA